jgi:hypothetical protein
VTLQYHRLRSSFTQEENYAGFVALVSAIGFVVLFLLMLLYSVD